MSPPVENLGDGDARNQRDSEDEERVRPSTPRPFSELRPARADDVLSGREVGRRFALHARHHKAWLHAAQEGRILGERFRQLGHETARGSRPVREALQLLRAALHERIASGHFLTGGCSPVATRQIRDASVRAPMVAAAPSPA
jgi:hypothetical protein